MTTSASSPGVGRGREPARSTPSARTIFGRVLVGVDGTDAGFTACRQARRLADLHASIEAIAVVHLADAIHAGAGAAAMVEELQGEAEVALEQAVVILGDRAGTRFVNGDVTAVLLREINRVDATLLALGSHGHRRATEMLLGGTAGELLHRAPCSILIARPQGGGDGFPRSIAVGLDGSREAALAHAAALELSARYGSELRTITALKGKAVDLEQVRRRAPRSAVVDEHPVEALVEASRAADLLVVGSRGLHGLRALGSVSERVAHQAACSVLVARPPAT